MISYKDSSNRKEIWHYDNDNLINFCKYNGDEKTFEIKNQYDERGNKIYSNTNGFEEWFDYDNNQIIHFRNSEGYEYWNNYVEV